jgi:hypothetical protein
MVPGNRETKLINYLLFTNNFTYTTYIVLFVGQQPLKAKLSLTCCRISARNALCSSAMATITNSPPTDPESIFAM